MKQNKPCFTYNHDNNLDFRVCLSCLLVTGKWKDKVSWENLENDKNIKFTKWQKVEFYKAENLGLR